ncbi:integrase [Desulfitobacterium hafniense]|nr:integrase [Desulfitobacterium hafniense]
MDDMVNAPPLSAEDEIIKDTTFTYQGYQVVRSEFFAHINEPSIIFNNSKVSLNTACVNKLPNIDYVQILVNPEEMKLAVRPCGEDAKDSLLWCGINKKNGRKKPRQITCKILFAKIVQLMGWNPVHRYKMMGKLIESNGEYIFIFDLKATEVYQRISSDGEKPRSSRVPVFPAEWQDQFGLPVEEHQKSLQINIFNGYAIFGIKDSTVPNRIPLRN